MFSHYQSDAVNGINGTIITYGQVKHISDDVLLNIFFIKKKKKGNLFVSFSAHYLLHTI